MPCMVEGEGGTLHKNLYACFVVQEPFFEGAQIRMFLASELTTEVKEIICAVWLSKI